MNLYTLTELEEQVQDAASELLIAEDALQKAIANKDKDAEGEAYLAIEDAQAELNELLEAEGQKLEGYVKMIKHLELLKKGTEAEIKDFNRRKGSLTNTIDWLKHTLLQYLDRHGLASEDAGKYKIAKQLNAPSVVVDVPAEELPEEFQRKTVTPDKVALRKFMQAKAKAGEGKMWIKGVRLVRKESLRIKVK